jgi:hypothetical protein
MSNVRCLLRRPLTSLATIAACLALAGCGEKFSQVSGAVTLDGQPVTATDGVMATIMFQPASGGAAAVGRLDQNGRYHISTGAQSGLRPGAYVATCAVNKVIASTTGGAASAKPLSDPKYADAKTSGFRFTVQPGKNEFDLALTSPSKTAAGHGS